MRKFDVEIRRKDRDRLGDLIVTEEYKNSGSSRETDLTQRNAWEIENLKESERLIQKNVEKANERITMEIKEVNLNTSLAFKEIDKRVTEIEQWRQRVEEKLIALFKRVDLIRENELFLKRSLYGSIVTGIVGGLISFFFMYFK